MILQTLDQSELQGDGVALSLEEQLCALSLSEPSDSENKDTVSLNGSRFSSDLFQDTRESTKVNMLCLTLLWSVYVQYPNFCFEQIMKVILVKLRVLIRSKVCIKICSKNAIIIT